MANKIKKIIFATMIATLLSAQESTYSFLILRSDKAAKESLYTGSSMYALLVYNQLQQDNSTPSVKQLAGFIAVFEKMIITASESKDPIIPGLCAHLGYLYQSLGYNDKADKMFQFEKELYPESSFYIDSFIEKNREN